MTDRLAVAGGTPAVTLPWPRWPIVTPEDEAAVVAALRQTETGDGETILRAFEEEFRRFHDRRFAVACSSGTAALHLGLAAVGVGPGDEVIVPAYSWGAPVAAILHSLALPVFADVRSDTFTLDPEVLPHLVTPRTRAIVVVHLYGMPADLGPIVEFARGHRLAVIEDCSQAHGARYRGRLVGTWGEVGAFSLEASKAVAALEGGIVIMDDRRHYEPALALAAPLARAEREIGDPALRRWLDTTTFHHRMHPLAAALARTRLGRLERDNADRRRNVRRFRHGVARLAGLRVPPEPADREPVYSFVALEYRREEAGGLDREAFVAALRSEGVPATGYVGTPLHLLPRMREHHYFGPGAPWNSGYASRAIHYREGDCPVAERICAETEVTFFTGGWVGDRSALADQVALAFRKVCQALARSGERRSDPCGNRITPDTADTPRGR